ncbi:hypothetical protein [Streptomyces sp. CS014]|uniref:hypothetical protein n=1 Tax=Streptomyces sp. CS014 TaxID=2162707 RepID=UPI000D520723|nr:hypothetical protein [Streptomyces sp. CS014]PVC82114.1 hypothetical protein DBP12_36255 [Streptomyces sp. CS014]
MSTTRKSDGHKPEEPDPEQSGAEQPDLHNRPESVRRSFVRSMAEGAGQVVGTMIASAIIIGLTTGGVIAIQQETPYQIGGGSCTA